MKLSQEQLTDYLVNADIDLAIVRRDYPRIAEVLEYHDIDATADEIETATALANDDRYIQSVAVQFGEVA